MMQAVSVHQLTIRTAQPADVDMLRDVYRRASLSNDGDRADLLANPDALTFAEAPVHEGRTRVALEDSEVLIRKPIKELLDELDPQQFWQVHRATVVNTRAIAGVVRGMRDQADLKLKGRTETLTVSRNFTHLFKQM